MNGAAVVDALRMAGCVFAEAEAVVLEEQFPDPSELAVAVARRVAGEPLEVIVGWAGFAGLRVGVAAGVFVPRRRTELLARSAVRQARPGDVVVELCCGSGAVALALLAADPSLVVHAVDVDPAAVACARANLGARATVVQGDLFAALPGTLRGGVDLLVANAPYVPTDAIATMPVDARDHEPRIALDGGADGLDLHRRIAAHAPAWLSGRGTLLIETSESQARGTLAALSRHGFATSLERDDDLDATVAVGVRPP